MNRENIDFKIYIIKTANKILGPYTIKEIIDQMWARKLHAFDEVKTPFTRWSFIRDDEALGKVFKDIIESRISSEDKADITTTLNNTAITVSNKLLKIKEATHLTASFVDADSIISDYKDNAEDIELKGSSIKVITAKPSYHKKHSNIQRYLYVAILIVSILLFGSLLLEESRNLHPVSVTSNVWDKANYLGDVKAIIDIYRPTQTYNLEANYRFIEAFISEDKFLEAEEIIKKLQEDSLQSKDKAKLINYQGVIELHRQNFELGITKFKEALKLDPTFEETQLNLVDGLLLLDDIAEAKSFLLDEVKLENAQSTSVYLHFETLFFDPDFTPEDNVWLNDLFTHVSQSYDQKQEILILMGLLLLEKNYVNESTQMLQRALDIDPDYLSQNVQTQALYHPKVVVQKTLVFLKRYEFKYAGNAYYQAAMAMLYHKSKSPILARKYLDQALRLNPTDPFLIAMHNLFDPKFDEITLTEKILTGNLTLLEAKLASTYCYQQDKLKCADDLWNYILLTDPNSVEAITGKLRLLIKKGLVQETKQWLNRGLGLAPRYIPLRTIELETKL